ncbi:DNA-(apurinic or apyrimidinic site) lyase 2-like isoform X2 [Thrips palmi]|nr:DNA-(apurinic or apyrimidinic site) lyase 2-like isoform X2 [Thrips palmi]
MIDEPTALVDGYNAYFSFSKTKSGYSGVATFCRESATPICAEEGLSGILQSKAQFDTVGCYDGLENEFSPQELKRLDSEGRTVITQHKIQKENGSESILTIFNVYCPRADPERPDRLEFKLRFNKLLELRASAVRSRGSYVMILGDINISHRQIDRCENVSQEEFEANPSRQWLNSFLVDTFQSDMNLTCDGDAANDSKMVDSFRFFHPKQEDAYTCWNTMINARATNYGSRIDYIFVDRNLIQHMSDSSVLSEVLGSDHCPVAGTFKVKLLQSGKCPSACIKNYPEFSGVQQKLLSFFIKKSSDSLISSDKAEETSQMPEDESFKRKSQDDPKIFSKGISKKMKIQGSSTQKHISSFFQKSSSSADQQYDGTSSSQGSSVSDELSAENGNVKPVNEEATVERKEKSSSAASAWKNMLTGPRPPPLCKGHKEPCVERIVKKKGPNLNKKFFACARGEGGKNDPRARCDHFEWANKK